MVEREYSKPMLKRQGSGVKRQPAASPYGDIWGQNHYDGGSDDSMEAAERQAAGKRKRKLLAQMKIV